MGNIKFEGSPPYALPIAQIVVDCGANRGLSPWDTPELF